MSAQSTEQPCIRRNGSIWTQCRCPDCIIYRRRQEKLRQCGRIQTLEQQQAAAWAALGEMLDGGWSLSAIAEACDIKQRTLDPSIAAYRAGRTRKLTAVTCAKLLGPRQRPHSGYVNGTGTARRLQALAWMGWTCRDLATQLGISRMTLQEYQRAQHDAIRAYRAHAVAELYERLQHTPGGSTRSTARARNKGWAPPAAWDNPDDLTERPKGLGGPKHAATEHILTEVNHLADQGLDFDAIAEALDREPTSLERLLQRHQQHPLLARLRRRAA